MRLCHYKPVSGGIGKTFDVTDDGKLVKGETRMPNGDLLEVKVLADLRKVHEWLVDMQSTHGCVTYGRPDDQITAALVFGETSSSASGRMAEFRRDFPAYAKLPVISRAASNICYRPGPVPFSVDNDPTPKQIAAGIIKTPEEVHAEICSVWPQASDRAWIGLESASTHLYIDGQEVTGRKGSRVILPGLMGPNIRPDIGPRAHFGVLHDRLIAKGLYSPFIAANGLLHLRTCIDLALYRPGQPDFLFSPILASPRLSQHRPPPAFHDGDLTPIDFETIGGLSREDHLAVQAAWAAERLACRDEMEAAREAWHARRDEIEFQTNGGTISREVLRRRRESFMERSDGVLPLSHAIHIDGGGWVTGAQIVANLSAYADKSCASPSEPEYGAVIEGGVGRHKGRIRIRQGQVAIIDYAHGLHRWYTFASDTDFDAVFGEVLDRAPAPVAGDVLPAEAGRADFDIFAADANAALAIQPPPPEARLPVSYPVIQTAEIARVALKTVADESDGIHAVLGQGLEIAVAEEFFRRRRGTIFVRDYSGAVALKNWIARVQPKATVMIMPGRTVDAAKLRATYGNDVFEYCDGSHDENLAPIPHGHHDEICMKRMTVAALHKIGLGTVSSHTCVHRAAGLAPEHCAHFDACGKIARLRAKSHHDFIIETAAALAGKLNPLLEGDDAVPADVLITDIADRPSAEMLEWPRAFWERQNVLKPWLAIADQRGRSPSYDDVGRGSKKALEQWGKPPPVRPDMDDAASLVGIKAYLGRVEVDERNRRSSAPTRIQTAATIDAWTKGHAIVRSEAEKVVAIVHVRPERLEHVSAFILSTTRASAENMISRLKSRAAAAEGSESEPVSPIGTTTTVASKRLLPSRIIQIVPDAGGVDVGYWLSKQDKDEKRRGVVRDVLHYAKVATEVRGPGIVLCHKETAASAFLKHIPGIQLVDFGDVSAVRVGGGVFRDDVSWAMVIGRFCPPNALILKTMCSAMPEDWPPSVFRHDGLVLYKSKPVYTRRDGAPHEKDGVAFRWTGSDRATDFALVAASSAPVLRLAEWLGGLPRETLMLIVDGFPLVSRDAVFDGVPADELLTMSEAIPPASSVLRYIGNKSVAEVATELGLSDRMVQYESKASSAEDTTRLVNEVLEPTGGFGRIEDTF